ncbi:hypothetical protein NAF17_01885 [Mucilaginibacter sp. RB4R14]|uniref:hypothetical protein n=1 Tax=Mucilaginibacter aurantiaciroseus TaxID=2949308 RepID=UPI002090FC69|nr:hypothetical protein [Mucilaginibacter aurantiaciroseus]MCO5934276.1 hypothetical protein [Mucilaginibacter aurantiaciroseus]
MKFATWIDKGITYYGIFLTTTVEQFILIQNRQTEVGARLKEKIELVFNKKEEVGLSHVYIIPKSVSRIDGDRIRSLFTKDQ